MTRTANELAEFLGCALEGDGSAAVSGVAVARFGPRHRSDLCGDRHAIWTAPPPPPRSAW